MSNEAREKCVIRVYGARKGTRIGVARRDRVGEPGAWRQKVSEGVDIPVEFAAEEGVVYQIRTRLVGFAYTDEAYIAPAKVSPMGKDPLFGEVQAPDST